MRRHKQFEEPVQHRQDAVDTNVVGNLGRWETFFYCQRSPVLRSQLLAALMSGTVLEVERIPPKALLDAVLLAFTARTYCSAEIVDNWDRLLERAQEAWAAGDHTTKVFDQMHAVAYRIVLEGKTDRFCCFEDLYIPDMVGAYLQQDAPVYFAQEFESDAAIKQWRRRK